VKSWTTTIFPSFFFITQRQRAISNTEKYIHWNRQLYREQSDRYHFAPVLTVGEAGKLIETGWEYVTDMEGLKLFREPK
jgi:hypothetical protein